MSFDPESAYAALFARLQLAAGFRTSSRRLEDWDNTPPAECPAFYLAMGAMSPPPDQTGLPPLWLVRCAVVIYARNDADPQAPPSTQLNQLIAAIVGALKMQTGEVPVAGAPFLAAPPGQWPTTLGGLAAYVRVSGAITINEGLIGGGAAAGIPLDMLLSS